MVRIVNTKALIQDQYTPPPVLIGYTYSPADAYTARDEGRLLALRLETNTSCNLRCRYCYARSGSQSRTADYKALHDIIRQGKELGLRSVVVIGGGEPTLYPRFRDLIAKIDDEGIIPMVFTNTMTMTRDLAEFLLRHNASVMGKLDSLRPETQDWLAGVRDASGRIKRGLHTLLAAGFGAPSGPGKLRLGVSFVSNRLNVDEIESIWQFCRENNIFPNMEILTPTGRARDALSSRTLDSETIRGYKMRLLEIDRIRYGHDWLPYTPLAASGCLQHLYSMYVTIDGDVRPCAPVKFEEHPSLLENGVYPYNIYRMNLREIYDSELFSYVRSIDRHLEGKCGGCGHLRECMGCRGYAYSVGVNLGMDPREALRSECRQCFRPYRRPEATSISVPFVR